MKRELVNLCGAALLPIAVPLILILVGYVAWRMGRAEDDPGSDLEP